MYVTTGHKKYFKNENLNPNLENVFKNISKIDLTTNKFIIMICNKSNWNKKLKSNKNYYILLRMFGSLKATKIRKPKPSKRTTIVR